MIVACTKCHDEFDVPPADLEGLDPELAVLVTCPVCGACGKFKAFEKEVVRRRKELAKEARHAKDEAHRKEARAAALAVIEARRKEEGAKGDEKKGLVDRLHERISRSTEDERLARESVARLSEASVSLGFKELLSAGKACLIIAIAGGLLGVGTGLLLMTRNDIEGLGVVFASLVFIATWWVTGHLLRAVAGIWSAVERTALAAEKNQPARNSQDSA